MNKETPLFLKSLKFRKSSSHPIGACCMLYGRLQGFIPRKPAKFQDHILRLHTVRLVHVCLALVWLMSATLRVYTLTSSLVTLCRCVDLRAYSTGSGPIARPLRSHHHARHLTRHDYKDFLRFAGLDKDRHLGFTPAWPTWHVPAPKITITWCQNSWK
jgi:hypothetical protein